MFYSLKEADYPHDYPHESSMIYCYHSIPLADLILGFQYSVQGCPDLQRLRLTYPFIPPRFNQAFMQRSGWCASTSPNAVWKVWARTQERWVCGGTKQIYKHRVSTWRLQNSIRIQTNMIYKKNWKFFHTRRSNGNVPSDTLYQWPTALLSET